MTEIVSDESDQRFCAVICYKNGQTNVHTLSEREWLFLSDQQILEKISEAQNYTPEKVCLARAIFYKEV